MSPVWVAQLHQAALCTDEPQIINLLEQIPDSHIGVKNTLINLGQQLSL